MCLRKVHGVRKRWQELSLLVLLGLFLVSFSLVLESCAYLFYRSSACSLPVCLMYVIVLLSEKPFRKLGIIMQAFGLVVFWMEHPTKHLYDLR